MVLGIEIDLNGSYSLLERKTDRNGNCLLQLCLYILDHVV